MDFRKGCHMAMAVALVLGGCAEGERPFGPDPVVRPPSNVLTSLECVAQVRDGSIGCATPEGSFADGVSAAVFGGHGNYVLIEASNVSYDGSVFSADVTIQNLLADPIGSTDGSTPHEDGVRIFFLSGNTVTSGEGTVTLANPSGMAMFTESEQPYFQYDAPIAAMKRSNVVTWRWNVPNTVESFTFSVAISAEVASDFEPLAPRFDASRINVYSRHSCARGGHSVLLGG